MDLMIPSWMLWTFVGAGLVIFLVFVQIGIRFAKFLLDWIARFTGWD